LQFFHLLTAQDEHKHDRILDYQLEDQAGDQALVKQEERCVQEVFLTYLSPFITLRFIAARYILTSEKENLMESKATLNS
jgi:hypothetical protein